MTDIISDFDAEYEEPEITRLCKEASETIFYENPQTWFDIYASLLEELDDAGCNEDGWWPGKLTRAKAIISKYVPLDEDDDTEASVLADTRR